MRFIFNPCPDCGHYEDPYIYRNVVRDYKGDMIDSTVKAVCRNCEWETLGHKNVEKCANDWNQSGAYFVEYQVPKVECELPF